MTTKLTYHEHNEKPSSSVMQRGQRRGRRLDPPALFVSSFSSPTTATSLVDDDNDDKVESTNRYLRQNNTVEETDITKSKEFELQKQPPQQSNVKNDNAKNNVNHSSSMSNNKKEEHENEPWRIYGQIRRQYLIDHDPATSYMTSSYQMNPACSIQKYFALAERIIKQFQDLYDEKRMEDAYVMGHRLITFLGSALPRHPSYATAVLQRTKAQSHLQYIKQTMEHITLLIDEEQLNRYITNDYDPIIDDDDDDDDDEVAPTNMSSSWETFQGGWSFAENINNNASTSSIPGFADTDESSQDIDSSEMDIFADFDRLQSTGSVQVAHPIHLQQQICDPDLTDIPDSEEDVDSDDDGSDEEVHFHTGPYAMQKMMMKANRPPILPQSILRKIAREAVRYESDSEAADSWAQQNDCGTNCGASDSVTSSSDVGGGAVNNTDSITSSPCNINHQCNNNSPCSNNSPRTLQSSNEVRDPARLAFRAIMNRHTQHLQSLQMEMESLLSTDLIISSSRPKKIIRQIQSPLIRAKQKFHSSPIINNDMDEEKKDEEIDQINETCSTITTQTITHDDKKDVISRTETFFSPDDTIRSMISLPPPAISAPTTTLL